MRHIHLDVNAACKWKAVSKLPVKHCCPLLLVWCWQQCLWCPSQVQAQGAQPFMQGALLLSYHSSAHVCPHCAACRLERVKDVVTDQDMLQGWASPDGVFEVGMSIQLQDLYHVKPSQLKWMMHSLAYSALKTVRGCTASASACVYVWTTHTSAWMLHAPSG